MIFIGVDLGWCDEPSGLAALALDGSRLKLGSLARLAGTDAILDWIEQQAGSRPAMIAVDAPLIIRNRTGSRPVDRRMTSAFGKYDAGCHACNLGRPFARLTTDFSSSLVHRGFVHATVILPRQPGRYQIEVHPHAATVQLFALDRIVKYKKGAAAGRIGGLRRYRELLLRLSEGEPAADLEPLPEVPERGGQALKCVEDQLDAALAAYVGAHWFWWGDARNTVYGDGETGYIVVPNRRDAHENPWRTLASKPVYENRWIRVREDRVIRPDGKEGIYGVVELRPSIGIVALNERGEIALAGQWRYTLGRYSWEIPRGGSLPGETDMLAAAQRELREEAGVIAARWRKLAAVDLNNGVTTDVEHLFLATELTLAEPCHDPEERIALRWVPLAQAVRMAEDGDITESCSVAAILMAARK